MQKSQIKANPAFGPDFTRFMNRVYAPVTMTAPTPPAGTPVPPSGSGGGSPGSGGAGPSGHGGGPGHPPGGGNPPGGHSSGGNSKQLLKPIIIMIALISTALLGLLVNKLTLDWSVDAYKRVKEIQESARVTSKKTPSTQCKTFSASGEYKLDFGCSMFSNDGSGPRIFTVKSDGEFAGIRSEHADKGKVVIGVPRLTKVCEAGTANNCRSWIAKHSFRFSRVATFTVVVPEGQTLVVDVSNINWSNP